jgi:SAM-dependent methyltransferase
MGDTVRAMSADPVDAAQVYGAMAAQYAADEGNPYNALYERPAMLALLGDVAGRRVLDAGCAAGALSAHLVARGARVTGIDVTPAMVDHARARGLDGATFAVADLADLPDPLPGAPFDLVAASLVLHYLRDWAAPLRALRAALAPGGRIVVSTHHPAMDVGLTASGDPFATELVHDEWIKGGQTFPVRFWRRPLSAMVDAFAAAGLVVERIAEPQPLPECRERFPAAWAQLTTQPWFVFFVLSAAGRTGPWPAGG